VGDSGGVQPRETRFALTAPPPVRSLAISAAVAVIAAAMIVLGSAVDLPQVVTIAGACLLTFAVALAVVALVLTAWLRTKLVLDSESITIIKGRRRRVLPWSAIEIVKRQGPRLLLITKPKAGADATVRNPGTATDATFDALIAEIQKRMNADRGYGRVL
jgi:hypothetical protein